MAYRWPPITPNRVAHTLQPQASAHTRALLHNRCRIVMACRRRRLHGCIRLPSKAQEAIGPSAANCFTVGSHNSGHACDGHSWQRRGATAVVVAPTSCYRSSLLQSPSIHYTPLWFWILQSIEDSVEGTSRVVSRMALIVKCTQEPCCHQKDRSKSNIQVDSLCLHFYIFDSRFLFFDRFALACSSASRQRVVTHNARTTLDLTFATTQCNRNFFYHGLPCTKEAARRNCASTGSTGIAQRARNADMPMAATSCALPAAPPLAYMHPSQSTMTSRATVSEVGNMVEVAMCHAEPQLRARHRTLRGLGVSLRVTGGTTTNQLRALARKAQVTHPQKCSAKVPLLRCVNVCRHVVTRS